MILEKLSEYADRIDDLPPLYFKIRSLDWLIEVDLEGNLLGFTDVSEEKNIFLFSDHLIGRSGRAIKPFLLGDNGKYVFGNVNKTENELKKREKKCLGAFYELIEDCYNHTKNPLVKAVLKFKNKINKINKPDNLKNNHWIGFRVNGENPLKHKEVQEFWQDKQREEAKTRSNFITTCMVCGKEKIIADRHTEPLKLVKIGGQGNGNPLISANDKAFESYGLENSYIAPLCYDCATLYGRAANYLIASEKNSLYIGNTIYIFWTKNNVDFNIATLLSDPSPGEIKDFLKSYLTGSKREINAEDFYILALSTNQSRTVVRDWIETTLINVKKNIVRFFQEMKLNDTDERYFSIYNLASATASKREAINPLVIDSLAGFALKGTPLDSTVLYNVINRVKADPYKITRPRAILLKMYFNSNNEGGLIVKEELDFQNLNDAYLCGRLFSVIEKIQKKALPGIKSTIVDRYYGSASSAPASVFGNLLRKAQHHLAKLRKEENRGAYYGLQKELEEIMVHIDKFPAYLSLKDQGMFALGYYQQKAYRVKNDEVKTNKKEGE